jgi:hypothetical protein
MGALACLVVATCAGCRTSPYTHAVIPRPDQQRWMDERMVIEQLTECVYNASFASKRDAAILTYANLLRHVYGFASLGNRDIDAGVRALNFVHRVHRQASGSRALWVTVLAEARAPQGTEGLRGIPVPDDYR